VDQPFQPLRCGVAGGGLNGSDGCGVVRRCRLNALLARVEAHAGATRDTELAFMMRLIWAGVGSHARRAVWFSAAVSVEPK